MEREKTWRRRGVGAVGTREGEGESKRAGFERDEGEKNWRMIEVRGGVEGMREEGVEI